MRFCTTGLFAALAMAVGLSAASAATIVFEDFEGYADTAAMNANWGSAGALGTLDTSFGNPGQSAQHPGGTVNSWIGSAINIAAPTGNEKIILSADIYNDATSTNERNTVGFRNGANPLFEMGHYNSTAEHYHVRVLGMYGNNNWVPLDASLTPPPSGQASWDRYVATFTATSLTVTLDIGADGTVDGTFTSLGSPSANPFVDLRFGGPSNLTSPGPIWVDNIRLAVVPEPASMALLGLGLIGACRAYRRRNG